MLTLRREGSNSWYRCKLNQHAHVKEPRTGKRNSFISATSTRNNCRQSNRAKQPLNTLISSYSWANTATRFIMVCKPGIKIMRAMLIPKIKTKKTSWAILSPPADFGLCIIVTIESAISDVYPFFYIFCSCARTDSKRARNLEWNIAFSQGGV